MREKRTPAVKWGRFMSSGRSIRLALATVALGIAAVDQPAQAESWLDVLGDLAGAALGAAAAIATGGAAAPLVAGLVINSGGTAAAADAAAAIGGEAMSCPVFVGAGTLLGEDSCLWSKIALQHATGSVATVDASTWRVGGQSLLAPGWYLGGTLGTSAGRQTAGGGLVNGQLQSYDGTVALKWVSGPWLVGGTFSLGTSTNQLTRTSVFGSSILQSNSTTYTVSGGLRAAYEIPFETWYLRPRGDVALSYANTPAFQEYGGTVDAVGYYGQSLTNVALSPALEIGGRINLGEKTILRPYVVGGLRYRTNNNWATQGYFTAAPSTGSFVFYQSAPPVTGLFDAGLHLYEEHGIEVRLEYKLAATSSTTSQTGSFRLGWHF